MTEFSLAAGFAPASLDDWRGLAKAALKHDGLDALQFRSLDGFAFSALATVQDWPRSDDDARRFASRAKPSRGDGLPGWDIVQPIEFPDPAEANAAALDDLKKGATGIHFEISGGPEVRGVDIHSSEDTRRLLAGIHLDLASVSFSGLTVDSAAFTALSDAIRARETSALALSFGLDPFGDQLRGLSPSEPILAPEKAAGSVRAFSASGAAVHEQGGSQAQELAFALAGYVEILRTLEADGMALEDAAAVFDIWLDIDADLYFSIVKLRAARLLWAQVHSACGLAGAPPPITGRTSPRMISQADPWTNIMRASIAAFAGGCAGVDRLIVLPFDRALGLPDGMARRIARNMQTILQEEAYLARVADPAGGAWAIEKLTDQLAGVAWSLFQQVEKAGGLAATIGEGYWQREIAAVRAQRQAAIDRGAHKLVGVTAYQNADDRGLERRPARDDGVWREAARFESEKASL